MKKKLSIICSTLYLFNVILHLLLAFGAPLGEYVLGGFYIVIPLQLRIVNVFFFILWLYASYSYLAYAGILKTKTNLKIIRRFLIGITIFTSSAIFSNLFITNSIKEKILMTPLTIIVSLCSILLLIKYKCPSINEERNTAKIVVAINRSPRKNGNTATLLRNTLNGAKLQGANVEFINLIDFNYKGCISCFACKRRNTKFIGRCAVNDELTPILDKIMEADAVVFGTPIYLGNITGQMHSLIERLTFMNASYSNKKYWHKTAIKNGAFIYTMNDNRIRSIRFSYIYFVNTLILKKFGGYTTKLLSTNTYQFDDYSHYDALNFNETKKKKVQNNIFPKDCKKAFDIGRKWVLK